MRGRPCWLAAAIWLLAALTAAPALAADWLYTVRPGDTFWTINENLLDGRRQWQAIASHNNLAEDAVLLAGQRLQLPTEWLEVTPENAVVARLGGSARRVPAGSAPPQDVRNGTELYTGDRLDVSDDGYVIVQFADESRLLVAGGSSVTFDAIGSYGEAGMVDTSMRLHSGRIDATVNPVRGPAGSFRIRTPAAVAAVRGTEFRVAFDDATSTARGEVENGSIALRGTDAGAAAPLSLAGGYGVVAKEGEPLPPPVELLDPPQLASPGNALQESTTLGFEWPANPLAQQYRARLIDASGSADDVLSEALLDAPRWVVAAPPDGRYRLDVRAIAADGLEGLTGTLQVEVDALPLPPQPAAPLADATAHSEPPELRWEMPDGTLAPRLQIAADARFDDLRFDQRIADGLTALRPPVELEPGRYWWRLAGFAADGQEGPFSAARPFEMLVVPAGALAGEVKVADGRVELQWPEVPFAARYRVEVAHDDAFEDMRLDEVVDATRAGFDAPNGGEFFYRVRGISAEQVAGPVSATTRFDVPVPPWPPWLLILLAPLVFAL